MPKHKKSFKMSCNIKTSTPRQRKKQSFNETVNTIGEYNIQISDNENVDSEIISLFDSNISQITQNPYFDDSVQFMNDDQASLASDGSFDEIVQFANRPKEVFMQRINDRHNYIKNKRISKDLKLQKHLKFYAQLEALEAELKKNLPIRAYEQETEENVMTIVHDQSSSSIAGDADNTYFLDNQEVKTISPCKDAARTETNLVNFRNINFMNQKNALNPKCNEKTVLKNSSQEVTPLEDSNFVALNKLKMVKVSKDLKKKLESTSQQPKPPIEKNFVLKKCCVRVKRLKLTQSKECEIPALNTNPVSVEKEETTNVEKRGSEEKSRKKHKNDKIHIKLFSKFKATRIKNHKFSLIKEKDYKTNNKNAKTQNKSEVVDIQTTTLCKNSFNEKSKTMLSTEVAPPNVNKIDDQIAIPSAKAPITKADVEKNDAENMQTTTECLKLPEVQQSINLPTCQVEKECAATLINGTTESANNNNELQTNSFEASLLEAAKEAEAAIVIRRKKSNKNEKAEAIKIHLHESSNKKRITKSTITEEAKKIKDSAFKLLINERKAKKDNRNKNIISIDTPHVGDVNKSEITYGFSADITEKTLQRNNCENKVSKHEKARELLDDSKNKIDGKIVESAFGAFGEQQSFEKPTTNLRKRNSPIFHSTSQLHSYKIPKINMNRKSEDVTKNSNESVVSSPKNFQHLYEQDDEEAFFNVDEGLFPTTIIGNNELFGSNADTIRTYNWSDDEEDRRAFLNVDQACNSKEHATSMIEKCCDFDQTDASKTDKIQQREAIAGNASGTDADNSFFRNPTPPFDNLDTFDEPGPSNVINSDKTQQKDQSIQSVSKTFNDETSIKSSSQSSRCVYDNKNNGCYSDDDLSDWDNEFISLGSKPKTTEPKNSNIKENSCLEKEENLLSKTNEHQFGTKSENSFIKVNQNSRYDTNRGNKFIPHGKKQFCRNESNQYRRNGNGNHMFKNEYNQFLRNEPNSFGRMKNNRFARNEGNNFVRSESFVGTNMYQNGRREENQFFRNQENRFDHRRRDIYLLNNEEKQFLSNEQNSFVRINDSQWERNAQNQYNLNERNLFNENQTFGLAQSSCVDINRSAFHISGQNPYLFTPQLISSPLNLQNQMNEVIHKVNPTNETKSSEQLLPWRLFEIELAAFKSPIPDGLEVLLNKYDKKKPDARLQKFWIEREENKNRTNKAIELYNEFQKQKNLTLIFESSQNSTWYNSLPDDEKKNVSSLLVLGLVKPLLDYHEKRLRENISINFELKCLNNAFEIVRALKGLKLIVTENGEMLANDGRNQNDPMLVTNLINQVQLPLHDNYIIGKNNNSFTLNKTNDTHNNDNHYSNYSSPDLYNSFYGEIDDNNDNNDDDDDEYQNSTTLDSANYSIIWY